MVCTAKLRSLGGLGINLTEVYTDWQTLSKVHIPNARIVATGQRPGRMEDRRCQERAAHAGQPRSQRGRPAGRSTGRSRATPRLVRDLAALLRLFSSSTPVTPLVRPAHKDHVGYGGGDAAADGFGAGLQKAGKLRSNTGRGKRPTRPEDRTGGRLPTSPTGSSGTSRLGKLDGFEMWLATDNKPSVSAATKGRALQTALRDRG